MLILKDVIIMAIFGEFLSFRDYILKILWVEFKKKEITLEIIENPQM